MTPKPVNKQIAERIRAKLGLKIQSKETKQAQPVPTAPTPPPPPPWAHLTGTARKRAKYRHKQRVKTDKSLRPLNIIAGIDIATAYAVGKAVVTAYKAANGRAPSWITVDVEVKPRKKAQMRVRGYAAADLPLIKSVLAAKSVE